MKTPKLRRMWVYEDDLHIAKIKSAQMNMPMSKMFRQMMQKDKDIMPEDSRRDRFKLY